MLIYKIVNNINNKIYIGQTTQTLTQRIHNYKAEYKTSNKRRPIIDAMRKYGFEHFSFEVVIDNIPTKEEMDKLERYYIQQYHSICNENGYNVELGGNSTGKHSEQTKKKISQAQMGKKNHRYGKTGAKDAASKPIIELTTGKCYESANLAAQDLGVCFSHVCSVARGERGSTGGFVFRYLDSNGKPQELINPTKIKSKITKLSILPQFTYLI